MRTGSPDLVDALAQGARTYDLQVRLGGRDVTSEVTSWSVERGTDTGLPEQVATPTGSTSAAAALTLSGSGTQTAAARYSPWAPRATADVTRPGQSCVLEWGLAEERLQSLRGRIRRVETDSRSGTASVDVLDGAELLRGRAWLPPTALPGRPGDGLHTQWVVDHALRESGIYTSPPAREDAVFFASMHGSRAASRGALISTTGLTGYYPRLSPWTAGPASTATGGTNRRRWSALYAPQRRVLSQANTLLVEWWTYQPDDEPESVVTETELVFANRPASESGHVETRITLSHDALTRALRASVDGASSIAWPVPSGGGTRGRFKVAFLISLSNTSTPVTIRSWLYQPAGVLYSSAPWTSGRNPVWGVLESVSTTATIGTMECVGVTPVTGSVTVVEPWRRTAVLDLIPQEGTSAGNAVYSLTAFPEPGGTWWDLIKQIAADTMSYVWFDEDGLFRMSRYDYMSPDRTPPDPDLTITADRSLADIAAVEEIDGVANRVEWGYSPHYQRTSQATEVYEYSEVFTVRAGATVEIRIDLQGRPWGLRAPMLFSRSTVPAQGPVGSLVKLVTSTGTLAPVETELVWDGGTPVFRFHNRGSNDAYAAMTSARTTPSFRPAHATLETLQVQPVTRQVPASIARYGTQSLEVGASAWVQSVWWADNLAMWLVGWTAWPMPITGTLRILPDPRIQLGDVVRIVDREGVRVDGVYRVLGYRVEGQGAAVTMSLDVRPLSRPDQPQDSGLTVEPIADPAVAPSLPG